jgi:hypothetical protein
VDRTHLRGGGDAGEDERLREARKVWKLSRPGEQRDGKQRDGRQIQAEGRASEVDVQLLLPTRVLGPRGLWAAKTPTVQSLDVLLRQDH